MSEREAALRTQLAELGVALATLEGKLVDREAALVRAEGAARQLALLEGRSAGLSAMWSKGTDIRHGGYRSGVAFGSMDGEQESKRSRIEPFDADVDEDHAPVGGAVFSENRMLRDALERKDGVIRRMKQQVDRMGMRLKALCTA